MAKKSMIAREIKRAILEKRNREKREKLKALTANIAESGMSADEFIKAQKQLQSIPKNASPVRQQRRCRVCGRPRSVIRKFGLCRICIRVHGMLGNIPGLVKASW